MSFCFPKSLLPALTFLLLLIADSRAAENPPARILFIGNSYTSVNNLPGIFKNIIVGEGRPAPEIGTALQGGLTLLKHSQRTQTLQKIDEGNWDVVILQGQSQESSMAEAFDNMRKDFLAGATALCDRIRAKSPKACILFYETWARHADYWVKPGADLSIGKSPADMQARIRKWYGRAAADTQKHGTAVAPVGDAWELNYKSADPIRLHAPDNSHPVFAGTYLAALVFYGTVYHPGSLAVKFHGKLDDKDAARLQQFAAQALQLKMAPVK